MEHTPFNVIYHDFNSKKFEAYDVMPYFISEYNDAKEKPKTFEEFKDFIKKKSTYMYWSRCQYEIIICGWPSQNIEDKWDIHRQLMMNHDVVTQILMDNVQSRSKKKYK